MCDIDRQENRLTIIKAEVPDETSLSFGINNNDYNIKMI